MFIFIVQSSFYHEQRLLVFFRACRCVVKALSLIRRNFVGQLEDYRGSYHNNFFSFNFIVLPEDGTGGFVS
jgi:hypothetical protein